MWVTNRDVDKKKQNSSTSLLFKRHYSALYVGSRGLSHIYLYCANMLTHSQQSPPSKPQSSELFAV